MPTDTDDLLPDERRLLARLDRESAIDGAHEVRTISALRSRGLLGSRPTAAWRRTLVPAAAAFVIFAAGVVTGRASAPSAAASPETRDAALLIQQTATAYVQALDALAAAAAAGRSAPNEIAVGGEAARSGLRAAMTTLATFAPSSIPPACTIADNRPTTVWY
jgi:hypothetical protein